jgi:DNA modification methylase
VKIYQPDEHQLSAQQLSVFSSNRQLPRHRWYDFKEGFSEDLLRLALDDVTTTSRRRPKALDPFLGSGTTLVACGRWGAQGTGIEVNPFLAFAAGAKVISAGSHPRTLDAAARRVVAAIEWETPSALEGYSTFSKRSGATKWLFNRSVLRGYEAARRLVATSRSQYAPAMRLSLIASLMDCCNAKQDGKCLRYRKDWQKRGFNSNDLAIALKSRMANVSQDLFDHPFNGRNMRIIEGDSRTHLPKIPSGSVDVVVTSPPYLNSFDYSDVYRPELFAGGFVSANSDLRRIRLRTIRSHVQVAWQPSKRPSPSLLIDPITAELRRRELWNHRLPLMVENYFIDLSDILQELHRIVRKGGAAWLVVSTSAYAGIEIPVDLILADIAGHVGWSVKEVFVLRNLRASGQHFSKHLQEGTSPPLRESLLVFRRR